MPSNISLIETGLNRATRWRRSEVGTIKQYRETGSENEVGGNLAHWHSRLIRAKRTLRWRRFPVDWIQDGGENRKSGFSDFGQVEGNPIE